MHNMHTDSKKRRSYIAFLSAAGDLYPSADLEQGMWVS